MNKCKKRLFIIGLCLTMLVATVTPALSTYADQTVYVTKTGSCYHAYAHGNGKFSATTLSAAVAMGLRPCKVCWSGSSGSASDNSSSSSESSATVVVKKPGKVSSVKEVSATSNSIIISWKKTKNATGYEVYTSTKKSSGFKKVKTISKASTVKCTVKKASGKKMSANKTYYVKVRAFHKSGNEKKTGSYSAVLKVFTAPSKVSSLKCTGYDASSIRVKWSKVKGANGYVVCAVEDWEDVEEADTYTTKKLNYTVSDLFGDTSYKLYVYPYKQITMAGKKIKIYGDRKSISVTLPDEYDNDEDE